MRWLGVLVFAACAHPKGGWLPDVKDRLDAVQGPGVAAFDWDNTVMKHDIGDATLWWMIRNDKIRQPPGRDWKQSSRWLTDAARAALNAACDTAAEPGEPMRTASTPACADAIFVIAEDGKTPAGEKAWSEDTTKTMKASYLWVAQLLAGWKMGDARDFARAAFAEAALAPIGTTQTVGTHTAVGWLRIYPQMQELIASLKQRGVDVWIVSASPQAFAEVMAEVVGVAPNHAIGVRPLLDPYEKLTAHVPGCGPAPDAEDSLITYNEGKRCWINKHIFKVPPAQQLTRLEDPKQRPVFAAGDSDTDVAFLQDAALKLVIDRHRPELMCNALNNRGNSWLVQPMFLEPLPPPAQKYSCSAYLDEAGQPIADQ